MRFSADSLFLLTCLVLARTIQKENVR